MNSARLRNLQYVVHRSRNAKANKSLSEDSETPDSRTGLDTDRNTVRSVETHICTLNTPVRASATGTQRG